MSATVPLDAASLYAAIEELRAGQRRAEELHGELRDIFSGQLPARALEGVQTGCSVYALPSSTGFDRLYLTTAVSNDRQQLVLELNLGNAWRLWRHELRVGRA